MQARLADNAIYMFALSASLSKMDYQIRSGEYGTAFERDRAALAHLFDLFELEFYKNIGEIRHNADESMRSAAEAARRHNDTLPNGDFCHSGVISGCERYWKGHCSRAYQNNFPGDNYNDAGGDGAVVSKEKTTLKTASKRKPSSGRKKSTTES